LITAAAAAVVVVVVVVVVHANTDLESKMASFDNSFKESYSLWKYLASSNT